MRTVLLMSGLLCMSCLSCTKKTVVKTANTNDTIAVPPVDTPKWEPLTYTGSTKYNYGSPRKFIDTIYMDTIMLVHHEIDSTIIFLSWGGANSIFPINDSGKYYSYSNDHTKRYRFENDSLYADYSIRFPMGGESYHFSGKKN